MDIFNDDNETENTTGFGGNVSGRLEREGAKEKPECTVEKENVSDARAHLTEVRAELNVSISEKDRLVSSVERAKTQLVQKEQEAADMEDKLVVLRAQKRDENMDRFGAQGGGFVAGKVMGSFIKIPGASVVGGKIGKVAGPIFEEKMDAISGRKTDRQIAGEISSLSNRLSVLRRDIQTIRPLVMEPQSRISVLETQISNLQRDVDSALRIMELAQKILNRCKNAKV